MKRVYFAAPLFCEGELDFNKKTADLLENAGYSVFLPQRDGILASELEGLTDEQRVKKIFEKDVAEVKKSDVLFMVLDGRTPDEGACSELGMAYAWGKKCYGIRTDVRALEQGLDVNPLLAGCFELVFTNSENKTALQSLKSFLAEKEL